MKIKAIEVNPKNSLIYLDRYVNDGSPSGFTEKNKTSPETDTFSLIPSFNLFTIEDDENNFMIYGSLKQNIPLKSNQFYVHPDMINHEDLIGFVLKKEYSFDVSPTSSFRTVKILSNTYDDYIKLHYPKKIGRIYRHLDTKRAIAGVEISKIIKEALTKNILSDFISIYEEPFAKIFQNPNIKNEQDYWGMVWRSAKPFGVKSKSIEFIIPLFSFWSTDRQQINDETFGSQLIKVWGDNAEEKFIKQLLVPILDTYFELLVKLGLQNEYNAQNILIGFDKSWNVISIILRDMMGIEKDLGIRKSLGLSTTFDSYPYKVISPEDTLYFKRHSFTFDFKVCEYVIEPLVKLAENCGLAKRKDIIQIMKDRTNFWIQQLPTNFFPKGKWYSHNKVDISLKTNRIYIENNNPLLRD